MTTLLRNGVFLTANPSDEVVHGAMLIDAGKIAALLPAGAAEPPADRVIDLDGHAVTPGFVQTHVHACQTLFRGAADDLPLLDWLRRRIWPMEAAHDEASICASAQLTALELLRGGTTAMLSMETVRHTEIVFDALAGTPLRAVIGKCLMDIGEGAPKALLQPARAGLDEALQLAAKWPARPGTRLRACLAPRFAISCSEPLLREVAAAARQHDLLIHTHGSEQTEEVEVVLRMTGLRNVAYLEQVGIATRQLRLAHAIHVDDAEMHTLRDTGSHVLHCPSSNLKLGSGIAPISRFLELQIPVSLGADGAPCNNSLDGLREMRLAALLQKGMYGPTALPAPRALRLLTIDGARALGMQDEIGSLEPGKQADLVEIDIGAPHSEPLGDPMSRVVYACERADIRRVFVDGEVVVDGGVPAFIDQADTLSDARIQAAALVGRAAAHGMH